ncbi:hypothetical protein CUMW_037570 [Citrus unshiu]|nr:hypothetical protein CUMW_037570 [Citrus unshiu]
MDQAYSEIQPLLGLVLIRWRMIMGSQIMDQGLAVLYRSKDFVHWVKVENPPTLSAKLECGSVRIFFGYTIGTYNVTTDKYIPEEGSMKGVSGLRYDYGQFYASKTFFDSAKNRRILWGWINESCIQNDDVNKGWSGLQRNKVKQRPLINIYNSIELASNNLIFGIPRSLWPGESGEQLIQWPIAEIERLRGNEAKFPNKFLEGGSLLEITDVEISFEITDLEKAEMPDSSWTNPQLLCSRKVHQSIWFASFGFKRLKKSTQLCFPEYSKAKTIMKCLRAATKAASSLPLFHFLNSVSNFILITLLLRALVLEAKLVSQPGFTQSWQLMIGHNDMLLTAETEGHVFVKLEASQHVYRTLQTCQYFSSSITSQPYRTGYHFQPPSSWMNGSVTILPGGNPAVLYTGIDAGNKQVQNLAVPKNLSDPYLKEWIKPPENPLMVPADQIDPGSFRDPTTAWIGPDKIWRVIIGSKINDTGLAILYRSKDFVNWTKAEQSLYSTNQSGMWECPDFFPVSTKSPKGVDTSVIGPNIKHVLKVSLSNYQQDYYTIGTYNITTDTYIAEEGSFDDNSGLRYDYGKFYASKTFFDSKLLGTLWLDKSGRQLMQWPISEIEKLRGNQVKWPAKLLERGSMVGITVSQLHRQMLRSHFRQLLLRSGSAGLNLDQPAISLQKGASVKGALGPIRAASFASNGLQEYTAVFFRIFKGQDRHIVLMCSDQSRSSINDDNDKTSYGAFLDLDPVHEKLSIRSLIDRSIVESFGGGGKACITARIYPTLAIHDKAHLYAFNNGTEKVYKNLQKPKSTSLNQPYKSGPMICEGIYHFFYQHNPKGPIWKKILVWGHSTSMDLINWISHDPAIRYQMSLEWINTSKNPLISPTDKIDPSLFRDTNTAWLDPGEKWRLVIGSEIKDTGLAILYKSKDLYIGYDYGKFYASKTFYDNAKHRRILLGWVNESSSKDDDIKKGNSSKSLARQISKTVDSVAIAEMKRLRANQVELRSKLLHEVSLHKVTGITNAQADIEISFETTVLEKAEVLEPSRTNPQLLCSHKSASVKGSIGPFGLLILASEDLRERTAVFFRLFKGQHKYAVLMCSDKSRFSMSLFLSSYQFLASTFKAKNIPLSLSLSLLLPHSPVDYVNSDATISILFLISLQVRHLY